MESLSFTEGRMSTGMAVPGLAMGCKNGTIPVAASKTFQTIYEKVCNTVFIDTHEHFENESVRLAAGDKIDNKANDWSFLMSHYFNSDFLVAGIPWHCVDVCDFL